jgi:Zn finger protein HypA/HybF involved in hydrogenase expression
MQSKALQISELRYARACQEMEGLRAELEQEKRRGNQQGEEHRRDSVCPDCRSSEERVATLAGELSQSEQEI